MKIGTGCAHTHVNLLVPRVTKYAKLSGYSKLTCILHRNFVLLMPLSRRCLIWFPVCSYASQRLERPSLFYFFSFVCPSVCLVIYLFVQHERAGDLCDFLLFFFRTNHCAKKARHVCWLFFHITITMALAF